MFVITFFLLLLSGGWVGEGGCGGLGGCGGMRWLGVGLKNMHTDFNCNLLSLHWKNPPPSSDCCQQTDTRWWLLPLVSIRIIDEGGEFNMVWSKIWRWWNFNFAFDTEEMLQPWTMRPDILPRWLWHLFTLLSPTYHATHTHLLREALIFLGGFQPEFLRPLPSNLHALPSSLTLSFAQVVWPTQLWVDSVVVSQSM